MKKLFLLSLAVIFTAMYTAVNAQSYNAVASKTTIKWHGEKIGGEHNGNIDLKSAILEMKNGILTGGSVVIDMTSIKNLDVKADGMRERLVNHLKSDDFFGVDSYPEAMLEVTGSKKSDDGLKVMGNLTIKGNTEPIEFTSSMSESGNGMVFKGKIEIDRTLFDVRYGSTKFFANIGDRAIDDMFTLDYEMYVE